MNYRFNFYIRQLSEKDSMSNLKAMVILGKETVIYTDQLGRKHTSNDGDCLFIPRDENDVFSKNRFKIAHREYYKNIFSRCIFGDGINILTAVVNNKKIEDINEIDFLKYLNSMGMPVFHNSGFTETCYNIPNFEITKKQQETIEIAYKILKREQFDVSIACYRNNEWTEKHCQNIDKLKEEALNLQCIGNIERG